MKVRFEAGLVSSAVSSRAQEMVTPHKVRNEHEEGGLK